VAADGVQSEPLSGNSLVTGNNTAKTSAFSSKKRQQKRLSDDFRQVLGLWSGPGTLWNREIGLEY
jgi:hypothetical protein